jgi:HK97 family phage portal protein
VRYLESSGKWVSTEQASPSTKDFSESLVERGLLHPDNLLSQASVWDPSLVRDGIVPMSYVRLTDGPGGQARWASVYDVMMTNPWGHGTIHTIARGLARLPLKLYEPDPHDDAEPGTIAEIINPNRKDPAGRIAYALRYPNVGVKRENSPVSRKALLYSTVVSKMVHGNAVWEKRKGSDGRLEGFNFHPAEQVDMDESAMVYKIHAPMYGGAVSGFADRKYEKTLTPDKVVHFGLWEGSRRPWTPTPVRALHASIALYDAVTRHMVAFFQNGARVSGHIKTEKMLAPKARDAIREEIKKLYQGVDNAGKVLITEGDFQQMHREPEFDGIVNLMKFSRDEIFVVYGVPPPVMGVIERAIMSNVREMRDQYVRDLIGPHAEFLAADFESQVIDTEPELRERQIFCEFDVDEQLRPDLWKRADAYRQLLLVHTPNEVRRMERQPPLDSSADPMGYADTIQRPLNETALNNMPNYVLRDELGEKRFGLEEQQVEALGAPTDDGGAGEVALREAERRATFEERKIALEERRQASAETVEERRLAQDDERIAIQRLQTERTVELAERGHDEVNVPRVTQDDTRIDLDERRVVVQERIADHDIAHGTGKEAHGPVPEPTEEPAVPADDEEPAEPVEEDIPDVEE